MSKRCIRVFRVRIGRCLVGAPSMLTSQWSPSARLSRQWRLAPLIGGRAGTDLQGQIRESHPGLARSRLCMPCRPKIVPLAPNPSGPSS